MYIKLPSTVTKPQRTKEKLNVIAVPSTCSRTEGATHAMNERCAV